MTQLILVSSIGAFALAAAIVPIVRCSFRQLGFVDQPDRERKLPTEAVLLGGGLAVFLVVSVTFGLVLSLDRYLGDSPLGILRSKWHTLLGAAGTLILVGLFDDLYSPRARRKLLFQLLVFIAVIGSGTVAQKIGFFGTEIDLGNFAFPIALLWLLAAISALNLIDGADAVAATAGAIISDGLAVLCLLCGSPLGAIAAAALAGSLLGFLLYNRPPASTYLAFVSAPHEANAKLYFPNRRPDGNNFDCEVAQTARTGRMGHFLSVFRPQTNWLDCPLARTHRQQMHTDSLGTDPLSTKVEVQKSL